MVSGEDFVLLESGQAITLFCAETEASHMDAVCTGKFYGQLLVSDAFVKY